MKPDIKGLHHDHIDGSLAVRDVIDGLYALADREFPFPSVGAWLDFFRNPRQDIVRRFATVTDVLQTAEALRTLGYAYGRRRSQEGFGYVEAKFAPQYHLRSGLTLKEAAEAMIEGLRQAESEFGIVIFPVIGIGREADPEMGVEIARVTLEYDGEVGLDLVCDEANHPPEKHLPAFRLTFGSRVRRDCHAGEWVAAEPTDTYRARLLQNVRTAVHELKVDGIGHAIPLADDPELMRYMAGQGIRVAGCPLSNLDSGLIEDVSELRIDRLLEADIIYTLNPDDDLFLPPPTEVIARCDDAYGFTAIQCRQLEGNVFRGAFDRRIGP
ncbi:hypothetical protein AMJ57_05600 [Parcubacteria bacterium SG8_24]|nr:MAG: hypothetical protein AMJ57_05600 [Parcubacteria bacterium SG8_24]